MILQFETVFLSCLKGKKLQNFSAHLKRILHACERRWRRFPALLFFIKTSRAGVCVAGVHGCTRACAPWTARGSLDVTDACAALGQQIVSG